MPEITAETRQKLAERMGDDMTMEDLKDFYVEEMTDRMQYWDESEFDEIWEAHFEGVTDAMKAKCPECGRVFDLLDETDAAEWGYGHDCE